MKLSPRFWLVVAILHLGLVVCGAAGWPLFSSDNPGGKTLRLYGTLSGADNGYGFFAPGVAAQIRARFVLQDETGRTWTDSLEAGLSHESQLRLGGAIGLAAYPEVREQLAASWAATMFGKHPSARRVTVLIDVMDLPTMDEFAAGTPKQWVQEFEGIFERE